MSARGAQGSLGELPVRLNVRLPGSLNMSGLAVSLSVSNLRRVMAAAGGAPPAAMRRLFAEGERDCAARLEQTGGDLVYRG